MSINYVIPKVENPCGKDCPDRCITCHSTCEKYNKYVEYNEKMRELRAMIANSTKCSKKVAGA